MSEAPSTREILSQSFVDAFHLHLDECDQCRNNPFGLCETGRTLLLTTKDMRRELEKGKQE